MKTVKLLEKDRRIFTFERVTKIVMEGDQTTIGYYDNDNVYHEETNDTPISLIMLEGL